MQHNMNKFSACFLVTLNRILNNEVARIFTTFYSSIFKLEIGRLKSLRDLLLGDAFLPLSSPIQYYVYIVIRTVRSYLGTL